MSQAPEPDVLIVGGSLVGLSAALWLRIHGVSCVVVERHLSTAIHPRAGHFQLRTVEILRSAGLEEIVRRRGEERYHPNGGINNIESLAGREIASYFPSLNAGARISTLDLFGRGFVLLAGAEGGEAWRRASSDAAREFGVALESFVVGGTELVDREGAFPDAYGLSPTGAVLVRPDGVVGWRSIDGDGASAEAVRDVLERLLCRRAIVGNPINSPV